MDESYGTLYAQLEQLIQRLSKEDVGVDDLGRQLELGYTLLERLGAKLTETEASIENIIQTRSGGQSAAEA